MSDSGASFFGFIIMCFLLLFFGFQIGASVERRNWEEMLVDAPQQVELIKARVIAERAEDSGK